MFGTDAPADRTAPVDPRRAEKRQRTRTADLTAEAFRAVAQSALPRAAQPQAKSVPIPATATDAELRMWAASCCSPAACSCCCTGGGAWRGAARDGRLHCSLLARRGGTGRGALFNPGATGRPLPTSRFVTIAALVLAVLGAVLCGQGAWIHAKALLAQVLLERAFAQSVTSGAIVKPWSWADTWPVAVIELPRIGARVIALEGGTGQALAFGPGHVELTPDAGERGTAVYAAHRDTHFAFLRDARIGDDIRVTRRDGAAFRFRVTATSVVHWDASGLDPLAPGQRLVLATCWPIDARTRGPLRYLVHAELVR